MTDKREVEIYHLFTDEKLISECQGLYILEWNYSEQA